MGNGRFRIEVPIDSLQTFLKVGLGYYLTWLGYKHVLVQSDPVTCLRSASPFWLRQPHSKMSRECQLTANVLCPLGKVICHCVAFCPLGQSIGMAEAAATRKQQLWSSGMPGEPFRVFITTFLRSELYVWINGAQMLNWCEYWWEQQWEQDCKQSMYPSSKHKHIVNIYSW